jgi:sec-independent protein translocase protein TatB
MMGISGMELMVIALVTLILFGPKELPEAIRIAARALGLLRRTAREFQREVDVLVRDSEVDSLRRKVEDAVRDTDKAPPPNRPPRATGGSVPSPSGPHPTEPAATPPAIAARSDVPAKADTCMVTDSSVMPDHEPGIHSADLSV